MFRLLVTVLLFWSTWSQQDISLMLITSRGGDYNSSGAEPAIDLAVEIINNNQVIPGHRLVIETRGDSNCDRQTALTTFLKDVPQGSDKLALIGCGCSIATLAVAEISSVWNLTHISFSSSIDVLNDRSRFPNFWRTHPSEGNIANVVLAILKEYDWNETKIITQNEGLFTDSTAAIMNVLTAANKTVITGGNTTFESSENVTTMDNFYVPEVRIYFLNMYSIHARRLLCNALQLQKTNNDSLYVGGYVWITLGWYRDAWWTEAVSQDNLPDCSDSALEELLLQSVAVQESSSALDRNAPTDVNLTAQEFKDLYVESIGNTYLFEPTAYYAYDAIWALAFAFNRSLSEYSLSNFSYSSGANTSLSVQNELNETAFTGVSGFVTFNKNGTRPQAFLEVRKYRRISGNLARILVALENGSKLEYYGSESAETVWPDGIPVDGTPMSLLVPILLPLTIVYYILATGVIAFAIVCLLFNFIFRKRKIVRLISPNLNYLIIIGAILLTSAVYFYTISTTNTLVLTVFCHIRTWAQLVGYFLCFGTIVAKIWRVYYLFRNPSVKKHWIPKDWHVFLIVMCMIAVLLAIIIPVAIFGDYKATRVRDMERPQTRNETTKVHIEFYNQVCEGPLANIWILLVFGYICITQIVAVILAFCTRKVHIKALNDSKQLTVVIYLSTIIITAMVICVPALGNFLNTDAAVFGGLLMVFAVLILTLMFIPKMVMLYKDPKGEKIFDRGQTQGTLNTVMDEYKVENFSDLEEHCLSLERRLSQHEEVVPFSRRKSTSSRRQSLTKSGGFTGSTSPGLSTIDENKI